MMEEAKQKRAGQLTLAISIIFALFVASFLTWLFWKWPEIKATGDAVVQNLPDDGVYDTGDILMWTKFEVCQPPGESTAEIWAVRTPAKNEPAVELKTLIVAREFTVSDSAPTCRKDNPTSVYIPGNLSSGTYRFEVRACVKNPTPVAECNTFAGPNNVKIRRISGNMPIIEP